MRYRSACPSEYRLPLGPNLASVNERTQRGRAEAAATSWDQVATWYDGWVGDRGSHYHRSLTIPAVLDLLAPERDEEILDVGGGQGVLAPYLLELGARYTGVDASPRLIALGKRRHGRDARFLVGDARRLGQVRGLQAAGYDAAVFMLSIQDMDPLEPVLESVAWALAPRGRVVILMTHPAFRQPRHSGWGFDEGRGLRYRRIDGYLTPMAVPMKALGNNRPTRAFHRPISAYVNGLGDVGFAVDAMVELPDLPPDERPGRAGKADARSAAEIPMFLALRALRLDS